MKITTARALILIIYCVCCSRIHKKKLHNELCTHYRYIANVVGFYARAVFVACIL